MPISRRTTVLHGAEIECMLDTPRSTTSHVSARAWSPTTRAFARWTAPSPGRARVVLRKVGFIENPSRRQGRGSRHGAQPGQAPEDCPAHREHPQFARQRPARALLHLRRRGTSTRTRMLANGTASVAVEGDCRKCGRIHVTSGDWRRETNPDRFVLVNPLDNVEVEDADLLFGNPLTHGDGRSRAYGWDPLLPGRGPAGPRHHPLEPLQGPRLLQAQTRRRAWMCCSPTASCTASRWKLGVRRGKQANAPPPTPLRPASAPPPLAQDA
jgi:hypothetical protein